MIVTMTEKERESLQWLLERAIPDLSHEIGVSADPGFRRFLRGRKDDLEQISELLRLAQQARSAA